MPAPRRVSNKTTIISASAIQQFQLQMPSVKKTKQIKRGRPATKDSASITADMPAVEPSDAAQPIAPSQPEAKGLTRRSILNIDPRMISSLPMEERKRLAEQHPEMNPYFLMSCRDKGKYFHLLNLKFREMVKPKEPPGSAPRKKDIRFKKRFEIRHFRHNQKCSEIKRRKSFMEIYRASRRRKLKRIAKTAKE